MFIFFKNKLRDRLNTLFQLRSKIISPFITSSYRSFLWKIFKKDYLFASKTNTIEIFANEEFGKVRVMKKDGEPWFVARDVAAALGYEDPSRAVQQHCKKSNKITQIGDSPVSVHTPPVNLLIIPESDVHCPVMRSNLLGAERSQDWIVEKVLIDRGLFVIKEGCVIGNDGESHITKTPKVTGKGQLYFINRFKEIAEQVT